MATKKYHGTWNGKQSRWFKKYDGKQYAVSVKELQTAYPHLYKSPTKEGSYLAFNQWWQDKQKTLTTHPQEAELNTGIETRRQLAAWCALEGQEDLRQTILAEIDSLKSAQRNNAKLTVQEARKTFLGGIVQTPVMGQRLYLDSLPVNPFTSNEITYHGEELDVWQQRLEALKVHESWEQKNKGLTFGQAVNMFLDARVADCSPGRVSNLRLFLKHFEDWKGNDKLSVSSIDLLNYKQQLIDQMKAGKKAAETARGELKAVKYFVNWCWENELTEDLPRNLRSKSLAIPQSEGKKKTWTDEQIKTALQNAEGRQRLYLLLMLNCGMYSMDIASLEHEHIDWDKGTVKWNRSKTKKENGLHFTLWAETFELLKKYRSEHPTLVLVNMLGGSLCHKEHKAGHLERKVDTIGLKFRRWNETKNLGLGKLKDLRKTARNKLENHVEFGKFAQAFLQQSARSVDEKWYRKPNQEQFDRALAWLREQFID